MKVLPANVATVGFYLTWEPLDWGRRHNAVAEKTKTVEQARNGACETEAQIAVEVGAKLPQMAAGRSPPEGGSHRTRSGHRAISGYEQ